MMWTARDTFFRGLRTRFRSPELFVSLRRKRRAQKRAHMRALELLESNLSPDQLESYRKLGHFHVVGGETGARYRIRRGNQMNVDWLDDAGRPVAHLCFLPKGQVPIADVMLAQKIALELNETETVAIAGVARAGALPLEWWME
jgi:hypothetical protein